MGVTRPLPTWLLLAGLAAVFSGWRVFDGLPYLSYPLTVGGIALLLLTTVWRFRALKHSEGDQRAIAAVFAFGTLGCVIGLAGFVPGTDTGLEFLGFSFQEIGEHLRLKRFFSVASPILLGCSLLPVLAAQWAVGRGGSAGALPVDALRVRGSSANALSLGLAGAALLLFGYVTTALDRTIDLSYFKTSQPGDAVREIVLGLEAPLQVAFFFPAVHPVKDELLGYFRELARATDRVVIEEYDRFSSPDAAADYEARRDGSVFLRAAGRTEQLNFSMDLEIARESLRVLDGHVQQALLQLARQRRFAYLTTGHGERNDPQGVVVEPDARERRLQAIREGEDVPLEPELPLQVLRGLLERLNYTVRDIGLRQGLGIRIPDNAAMVMILAPQRHFHETEMNAIFDYVDRGGSLLVALEPGSEFRFEEFRDRLGIDYDPAMTLDDQLHYGGGNSIANRRLVLTNKFSTHPAVSTAGRAMARAGLMMDGPGRVSEAEDAEGLRITMIISAYPTNYQDRNNNFQFDEETEEQGSHGIAAAVERVAGGESGEDTRGNGMRALVYADADIFTDAIMASQIINTAVVGDGIQWLGREEEFSGEVVSEADVPIVHTRAENVIWFYSIIWGAPLLVLGAGLLVLYRRRRVREGDGS